MIMFFIIFNKKSIIEKKGQKQPGIIFLIRW